MRAAVTPPHPEENTKAAAPPTLTVQASWLLFAKVTGFAVTFVVPLLLVRVLNQHDFGIYKQAFLLIANAVPLLTLWFHMNLFYFLPREKERKPSVVLNTMLVNSTVGMATFLTLWLWPGLLARIFGSNDLVPYSPLIGAVILVWMVSGFLEVVATANQEVKYSTIFIISAQSTKSIMMILAALLFASVKALLYASLIQGLIQMAILQWYAHTRFGAYWKRTDWPLFREQLQYGIPLGLAAAAAMLQMDLHLYVVAHHFSAAEYAIYAIGCAQLPLIALLRESINGVVIPRVAQLQQAGATREIVNLLAAAARKLALVYAPLFAFLMVFAYEFLTVLYGRQYAASQGIFMVNLVFIPLNLLIMDSVMRAYIQNMPYLLKVRALSSIIVVPAVYLATANFGMIGAISAVVIVVSLERMLVMWKVARTLHLGKHDLTRFQDVAKIGIAAGCAALTAAGVRQTVLAWPPFVVLVFCGIVFSIAYLTALAALQVATPNERSFIRRKLRWAVSR